MKAFSSEAFAQRLSELMQEKDVNQSQLAKITNVSNEAVSAWLLKKREPMVSSLCKIAIFFDCSLEYLIGNSDDF